MPRRSPDCVVTNQICVHGDEPSEVTLDQFRRFLVDTPLMRHSEDHGGRVKSTSSTSRAGAAFAASFIGRGGSYRGLGFGLDDLTDVSWSYTLPHVWEVASRDSPCVLRVCVPALELCLFVTVTDAHSNRAGGVPQYREAPDEQAGVDYAIEDDKGACCAVLLRCPQEDDTNRDAEITEGRDSLLVPYGSYHQLYRIDGILVAVGVVDILPKCLVSQLVAMTTLSASCSGASYHRPLLQQLFRPDSWRLEVGITESLMYF